MDKIAVVHIHDGLLLTIKKNAFESVLMRWMKLEPNIQSEVKSERKTPIYQRIYMEFRKMVMITLYARQKRDTDVKNRLLDSVGEREGGMI